MVQLSVLFVAHLASIISSPFLYIFIALIVLVPRIQEEFLPSLIKSCFKMGILGLYSVDLSHVKTVVAFK